MNNQLDGLMNQACGRVDIRLGMCLPREEGGQLTRSALFGWADCFAISGHALSTKVSSSPRSHSSACQAWGAVGFAPAHAVSTVELIECAYQGADHLAPTTQLT